MAEEAYNQMVDVVVVGGGAAGLNAALVLARARRKVTVIDAGEPRNAPAAHMHGFLSRDGMPPAELLAVGRAEVTGYGGEILSGRVAKVAPGFTVTLDDGREVQARRVLVATGLWDELPETPGVRERWGADVVHCPYCHGYEVRDQAIGVLGNPAAMPGGSVHQALLVRQWSADVVLFANGVDISGDERRKLDARGVRVVPGSVGRLVSGAAGLEAVELVDGTRVARTAVFVAPRFVADDRILRDLGCDPVNGWVPVDPTGRTAVPGVWAAGNVVDPKLSVIGAAGAGAMAAFALNFDLVEEDIPL
ncbi:MAG: NAD(P)/FAD-dependent oxidoreductase [Hamadaea sp.]|nr:NAD(P)/FAD-dependent oxidoreductase [Hamadaea sp.]